MVCVICSRTKSLTATDACFRRWKRGFNQSRLSLCLAHKTCDASQYISSCLAAFLICYFPPCLSTQGRSGVLGGVPLLPTCPCGAIRRTPKRRTHRTRIPNFHEVVNMDRMSEEYPWRHSSRRLKADGTPAALVEHDTDQAGRVTPHSTGCLDIFGGCFGLARHHHQAQAFDVHPHRNHVGG